MTRRIEVVPHDPEWAARFRKEAVFLRSIFEGLMEDVHHIGSTAVPGLPAKPVIDLLVEVADIEKVDVHNDRLVELGYIPKGEFGMAAYVKKKDWIYTGIVLLEVAVLCLAASGILGSGGH